MYVKLESSVRLLEKLKIQSVLPHALCRGAIQSASTILLQVVGVAIWRSCAGLRSLEHAYFAAEGGNTLAPSAPDNAAFCAIPGDLRLHLL